MPLSGPRSKSWVRHGTSPRAVARRRSGRGGCNHRVAAQAWSPFHDPRDRQAGGDVVDGLVVALAAMVATLRVGFRRRAVVWAAALGYLVVGRFAVFLVLADVVVRECSGL